MNEKCAWDFGKIALPESAHKHACKTRKFYTPFMLTHRHGTTWKFTRSGGC